MAFLDLDGTLCLGTRRAGTDRRTIQLEKHSAGATVTTPTVADLIASWTRRGVWVPATARTVEQYQRIALPGGEPTWAVVESGGAVLRLGQKDPVWDRHMRSRIMEESCLVKEVQQMLCRVSGEWRVERVGEWYLHAAWMGRAETPPHDIVESVNEATGSRGWVASLMDRRCHLVPVPVNKANAVAWLSERLGSHDTLAAGDSWLDTQMLARSALATRPCFGQLHDMNWSQPNMFVAEGNHPLSSIERLAKWVDDELRSSMG